MATQRNPGRPRDPEVEAAILAAAARLLAEQGYGRMSIVAVATAAGVSRPAVYRRFETKADLAIAALAAQIDDQARPPADLDVEAALTRALGHLAQRLRAKHSMALIGTLLVEEEQTPELIQLFRKQLWTARAGLLKEILERGRALGEVRDDMDLEVVVGMMIGSLYAAHLSRATIPRGWPARVVKTALEGLR
ncbi:MAG: TetR/AcrR family transcriptional regulator [Gammaproteobacteria bacterium]|nr:TetR/AcrR family transcriptional regulator [Gammaproteobacteria bacterium]